MPFLFGANERKYEKGQCLLVTSAFSSIHPLAMGSPALDWDTARAQNSVLFCVFVFFLFLWDEHHRSLLYQAPPSPYTGVPGLLGLFV